MIQEIDGYRIDVLVNMCKTHYQIKQAWAGDGPISMDHLLTSEQRHVI